MYDKLQQLLFGKVIVIRTAYLEFRADLEIFRSTPVALVKLPPTALSLQPQPFQNPTASVGSSSSNPSVLRPVGFISRDTRRDCHFRSHPPSSHLSSPPSARVVSICFASGDTCNTVTNRSQSDMQQVGHVLLRHKVEASPCCLPLQHGLRCLLY